MSHTQDELNSICRIINATELIQVDSGSYSIVYKYEASDGPRAIKVYKTKPEIEDGKPEPTSKEIEEHRMHMEAEFKNDCSTFEYVKDKGIPHTVAFGRAIEQDGFMIIEMEYVEGHTFNNFLHDLREQGQGHTFTEERVRESARQMLAYLEALHAADVIHGDFKLDNILHSDDDNLTVVDYGCAVHVGPSGSFEGPYGSLIYMAPESSEIISGEGKAVCSFKSDIYALGMCFLILHFKSQPYVNAKVPKTKKGLEQGLRKHFGHCQAAQARTYEEKVSEEGFSLTRRMLSMDPKKRPTATEALRDPWFKGSIEEKKKVTKDTKLKDNVIDRAKRRAANASSGKCPIL